jgi:photosystem II stability/assembly factor-like uncharacterized protein
VRKWSRSFSNIGKVHVNRTVPHGLNRILRLLGATLFQLTLVLTLGHQTMWAQNYIWTERKPAGDADKKWWSVVSSSDGAKLVAGVLDGRLYISTDGGVTWTETQPAGNQDRKWICLAGSSDGNNLIAGAFGGRLYLTTDAGATWTETQPAGDINQDWYSAASSSDGNNLIVGDNWGNLYVSTNRGDGWTKTQQGTWWICLASSSDGNKLIGVDAGVCLYTSTDAGASWTQRQPDMLWSCVASSADGNKLIAACEGGRLYTSTDAGASWIERQPAGNSDWYWHCTSSSSDGNKLIAGASFGRLYVSTDAGINWTETQPAGNVDKFWHCAASSYDASRLIVGISSGRLYTGTLLTQPTISGHVLTSDSAGIDSVTMDGLPSDPLTDSTGYYTATVNCGWTGVVTPAKFGYTFEPESTSYSSVTDDQETDYLGTYLTYTISGYVRNTDSLGVEGVGLSGLPGDPETDTGGYYSAIVPYGWSGRVTPTDTCVFDPEYRDYDSVTSDQTYQSYVEDCFSQGVDDDKENQVPKEYQLFQNHPNPFNPETEIAFGLPKAGFVTLKVYNILGQEVTALVDRNMSAGRYRVTWNGTDRSGRVVSSGVYFYRMQSEDFVQTRRMLLLK